MSARLVILVLLALAGCGGEEFQDLRDFVNNAGADMRGKVEPPPDIKPYEPFAYDNSAQLPDPFKPRKTKVAGGRGGSNQPDFDRPKEELEEYPLDNLKMIGYLSQKGKGYAVLRSPDGKVHTVKAGNYIGLNFGQITEITEVSLKVKEMVQDSAGDWTERESSLQLIE
ncbi:MAG: pilus assembly protein PilP [Pseudomonadota bacterium]|jgi:type IV pilus assembly protein PilP